MEVRLLRILEELAGAMPEVARAENAE